MFIHWSKFSLISVERDRKDKDRKPVRKKKRNNVRESARADRGAVRWVISGTWLLPFLSSINLLGQLGGSAGSLLRLHGETVLIHVGLGHNLS